MDSFHRQPTLPHRIAERGGHRRTEIPKKVGPYHIELLLHEGGTSELYLATDNEKRSPLVVKVLSSQHVTNKKVVNQFLKEAEIIGLTGHPHIVKVYEQGEWDRGVYIAMEFIQGISLKPFITQQTLSTKSALEVILQVACALLHLHTHGIIHRDLKPENILLTERGLTKIIDFGIAQLQEDLSESTQDHDSSFLGTPSYMSPEQQKNPSQVTYTADIYSLGVIAFELITGQISHGSLQYSLLPKSVQKMIKKAAHPSPSQRYQDIVDLITDLSDFLKNHGDQPLEVGGYHVKETLQLLEMNHQDLLPASLPQWETFNIGLMTSPNRSKLGTFYDVMRFADRSYLIVVAKHHEPKVQSLVHLGLLKGIIESLVHSLLYSTEQHFNPLSFMTQVNHILYQHQKKLAFFFHLLHLLPSHNQFTSISCGFPSILHLPIDQKTPRFLTSSNPLLGLHTQNHFYQITENWMPGDLLIFHSFTEQEEKIETKLSELLPTFTHFPAQKQASSLLLALDQQVYTHNAQYLFCLHRH